VQATASPFTGQRSNFTNVLDNLLKREEEPGGVGVASDSACC
jgi:hypothetical protein